MKISYHPSLWALLLVGSCDTTSGFVHRQPQLTIRNQNVRLYATKPSKKQETKKKQDQFVRWKDIKGQADEDQSIIGALKTKITKKRAIKARSKPLDPAPYTASSHYSAPTSAPKPMDQIEFETSPSTGAKTNNVKTTSSKKASSSDGDSQFVRWKDIKSNPDQYSDLVGAVVEEGKPDLKRVHHVTLHKTSADAKAPSPSAAQALYERAENEQPQKKAPGFAGFSDSDWATGAGGSGSNSAPDWVTKGSSPSMGSEPWPEETYKVPKVEFTQEPKAVQKAAPESVPKTVQKVQFTQEPKAVQKVPSELAPKAAQIPAQPTPEETYTVQKVQFTQAPKAVSASEPAPSPKSEEPLKDTKAPGFVGFSDIDWSDKAAVAKANTGSSSGSAPDWVTAGSSSNLGSEPWPEETYNVPKVQFTQEPKAVQQKAPPEPAPETVQKVQFKQEHKVVQKAPPKPAPQEVRAEETYIAPPLQGPEPLASFMTPGQYYQKEPKESRGIEGLSGETVPKLEDRGQEIRTPVAAPREPVMPENRNKSDDWGVGSKSPSAPAASTPAHRKPVLPENGNKGDGWGFGGMTPQKARAVSRPKSQAREIPAVRGIESDGWGFDARSPSAAAVSRPESQAREIPILASRSRASKEHNNKSDGWGFSPNNSASPPPGRVVDPAAKPRPAAEERLGRKLLSELLVAEERLGRKSLPELLVLCRERGIETKGMYEKSDLLKALKEDKGSPPPVASAVQEIPREAPKPRPQQSGGKSFSELLALCKERGIETEGMFEKSDLVQALKRRALKQDKGSPPPVASVVQEIPRGAPSAPRPRDSGFAGRNDAPPPPPSDSFFDRFLNKKFEEPKRVEAGAELRVVDPLSSLNSPRAAGSRPTLTSTGNTDSDRLLKTPAKADRSAQNEYLEAIKKITSEIEAKDWWGTKDGSRQLFGQRKEMARNADTNADSENNNDLVGNTMELMQKMQNVISDLDLEGPAGRVTDFEEPFCVETGAEPPVVQEPNKPSRTQRPHKLEAPANGGPQEQTPTQPTVEGQAVEARMQEVSKIEMRVQDLIKNLDQKVLALQRAKLEEEATMAKASMMQLKAEKLIAELDQKVMYEASKLEMRAEELVSKIDVKIQAIQQQEYEAAATAAYEAELLELTTHYLMDELDRKVLGVQDHNIEEAAKVANNLERVERLMEEVDEKIQDFQQQKSEEQTKIQANELIKEVDRSAQAAQAQTSGEAAGADKATQMEDAATRVAMDFYTKLYKSRQQPSVISWPVTREVAADMDQPKEEPQDGGETKLKWSFAGGFDLQRKNDDQSEPKWSFAGGFVLPNRDGAAPTMLPEQTLAITHGDNKDETQELPHKEAQTDDDSKSGWSFSGGFGAKKASVGLKGAARDSTK